MKKRNYYKDLDFIRLLSCIAVLLYHLNILKGGFLAVCIFFVLTGYLSCVSAFKKEKFSIIEYYKDKFLHIYLPLLLVVFISIVSVDFLTSVNWLNLKPETTSVIFGYNNFWQLSANLDYFTRHVSSPFMHFWYMGILLQFELVFPILFILLKKIGDKLHKSIPCFILSISSIGLTIYFYLSSIQDNVMFTYYNTFTRLFSILFGVTIAFIYEYYKKYNLKILNKKIFNRIIFYSYIIVLIILFIFIDSKSKYFAIAMIITSIITCRLINYGTNNNLEHENKINKIIKFFANISYEIYLVQYPVIFIFQNISMKNFYLKNSLIIIITILISYLINFSIKYKKEKNNKIKYKKIKILLLIILLSISSYGVYKYLISKDYTKEAEKLKEELARNEELMKQKQIEYEKKLKEDTEAWEQVLNDLNTGEEKIKEVVKNLHVIGIGDSVILDAIPNLYKYFPNGYFDAKQSRTDYEADEIIAELKKKNMLGEPIVFGLGTNGQCGIRCQREIVKMCGNRKIFWINVTNDYEVHVNKTIKQLTEEFNNVYLIDWETISKGHKDYFIYDGVHLRKKGQQAYADAIYESIYNVYLEEKKKKKEEIINKHNEEQKTKINFYGNDLLLNVLDYIENDFSESKFEIDDNFNNIYKRLKEQKEKNILPDNLIFVFSNIKDKDINKILELLSDYNLFFVISSDKKININNGEIINIYNDINNNNYFMFDKKHLTKDGNIYLSNIIKNLVKDK